MLEGGSPHGFLGAAGLAIVHEGEAGPITATDVEGAIGTEHHRADRVTGELLTPPLQQHGLRAGHHASGGGQPGEPAADDAAIGSRAGRRGASVGEAIDRRPKGCGAADRGVERIEDVHVGCGREVRMQRHAEQATVPVVVHLSSQVGEDGGGRNREAGKHLDEPALLGDEHAAVRRELDDRRKIQPIEHDLLVESGRQSLSRRRPGGSENDGHYSHEKCHVMSSHECPLRCSDQLAGMHCRRLHVVHPISSPPTWRGPGATSTRSR